MNLYHASKWVYFCVAFPRLASKWLFNEYISHLTFIRTKYNLGKYVTNIDNSTQCNQKVFYRCPARLHYSYKSILSILSTLRACTPLIPAALILDIFYGNSSIIKVQRFGSQTNLIERSICSVTWIFSNCLFSHKKWEQWCYSCKGTAENKKKK